MLREFGEIFQHERDRFHGYRRDDSAAEARLVADAARRVLRSESVFIDTEAIQSGEVWPDRLRAALEQSSVVLVVIGPTWLTAGISEFGERRIDNKFDWVRLEIACALADNQKKVIPILVGGARMPPDHVLPESVRGICKRQTIEIRRDYWGQDITLIASRLSSLGGAEASAPSAPSFLVAPFWNNLSPDLQDAFALAATAATRDGKTMISTRTLFAALRRLSPEPLRELFECLPPESLPKPVAGALPADAQVLSQINSFSGCVQDSLASLASLSTQEWRLAAEDIFVDIAKYGTGSSVRHLRTHGVDIARIDSIVRQLGWRIIERMPDQADA